MSFDLAAFSAVRPLTPEEARAVYDEVCKRHPWADRLPADERMEAFYKELASSWPELSSFGEDDEAIEGSPWAAGLDHSPAHVIASVVWPAAKEMEPSFFAMAMRHGVYAYDPQSSTLYDPGDAPTREHWLSAERDFRLSAERDFRLSAEAAASKGPWKAKGGEALAKEVTTAVLLPRVGDLKPAGIYYSFPVSREIEGRLVVSYRCHGKSRKFWLEAWVGVWHQALFEVFRELWGPAEPGLRMAWAWVKGLSQDIDADNLDEAVLERDAGALREGLDWARSVPDLDALIEQFAARKVDAQWAHLRPVALAMAGRDDEALAAIERWSRVELTSLTWAMGDARGPRRFMAFAARFNERYDPAYQDQSRPVLDGLAASGLQVPRLSELRDSADGATGAGAVLVEWLPRARDVRLKRELALLLGEPWAKDARPAAVLAREFLSAAEAEDPEHDNAGTARESIMAATGIAFSAVADEAAFEDAVRIAVTKRFGTLRAPFISALGRIQSAAGSALPVLRQLVDDKDVVPFALDALGDVGSLEALPLVERFVDEPYHPVGSRAREARSKLLQTGR
jgi:hypothetical protein